MKKLLFFVFYSIFASILVTVLEFNVYLSLSEQADQTIIQFVLLFWMFIIVFTFATGMDNN